MAALATPTTDDRPAGSIGHAVAEPVLAGSPAVVWLIGALHVVSTMDPWFESPDGSAPQRPGARLPTESEAVAEWAPVKAGPGRPR